MPGWTLIHFGKFARRPHNGAAFLSPAMRKQRYTRRRILNLKTNCIPVFVGSAKAATKNNIFIIAISDRELPTPQRSVHSSLGLDRSSS